MIDFSQTYSVQPSRKMKPHRNLSGPRIRVARLAAHPPVTQVVLVKCLRVRGLAIDQSILSRIEKRERGVTDIELKAIARCLNTTIAWLCGETGAKR
jgi:hypothetical protein